VGAESVILDSYPRAQKEIPVVQKEGEYREKGLGEVYYSTQGRTSNKNLSQTSGK